MTYLEERRKILSLIEEIEDIEKATTADPDIEAKLPYVINQVAYELARYKKIPAYYEMKVIEDEDLLISELEKLTGDNIYQIDIVKGVDTDVRAKRLFFNESGTAKIFYFKYPVKIDENTTDDYVFELDDDVMEIMPFGVAADLLKSDVSNNYGQIYAARYRELLQGLDPREGMQSATLEGGFDV